MLMSKLPARSTHAREKTAIVTGTQQGIGAGPVEGFVNDGYNAVATSLLASESLTPSPRLILADGDIRNQETASKTIVGFVQQTVKAS